VPTGAPQADGPLYVPPQNTTKESTKCAWAEVPQTREGAPAARLQALEVDGAVARALAHEDRLGRHRRVEAGHVVDEMVVGGVAGRDAVQAVHRDVQRRQRVRGLPHAVEHVHLRRRAA